MRRWKRRVGVRPAPEWVVRLKRTERDFRVRVSEWLSLRALKLGVYRVMVGFLVFFALFGFVDTWSIVSAVRGERPSFGLQQMHLPKGALSFDTALKMDHGRISFERSKDATRRELDSFFNDSGWKGRLDSLVRAKPGMADTIRALKDFFDLK